jgi:hypothetical protein
MPAIITENIKNNLIKTGLNLDITILPYKMIVIDAIVRNIITLKEEAD